MLELPHPKYFEGILQLRDCGDEVKKWVYDQVRKDQRALVTKEKKVRGGFDLYFSSQRYLRTLAKRLNEKLTRCQSDVRQSGFWFIGRRLPDQQRQSPECLTFITNCDILFSSSYGITIIPYCQMFKSIKNDNRKEEACIYG